MIVKKMTVDIVSGESNEIGVKKISVSVSSVLPPNKE